MMNAVWQVSAKFRNLLNAFLCVGLALFLSACSVSAQNPPVAQQQADLLDQDSDGVINARDRCENTPQGAVIDNDGCPSVVDVTARDDLHILFANDSATIPQSFTKEVQDLARFMQTFPQVNIELKGYASPVGDAAYNLALSKRRANSVKGALVKMGIDPSRIAIVGYGDADAVQADSPQETEVLSRRVTASVAVSESDVVDKWTIYSSR